MKLSEELMNAFNARDLVEIDFCDKAKKLEDELEALKEELDSLKKYFKDSWTYNWSNQR